MSGASLRIAWAVDQLGVKSEERLLEIGCGHGVAVSLVAGMLGGGHITAIDRSATMVRMSRVRNAAAIGAGRVAVLRTALHAAEFADASFNIIFAIHVGLFTRSDPARELALIRRWLKPAGRLFLIFQPLAEAQVEPTAALLADVLQRHDFGEVRIAKSELLPTSVAVSAQPAGH